MRTSPFGPTARVAGLRHGRSSGSPAVWFHFCRSLLETGKPRMLKICLCGADSCFKCSYLLRKPQGLGRDDHHVAFRIERELQPVRTTNRVARGVVDNCPVQRRASERHPARGKDIQVMTLYRSDVGVWNALKRRSSACGGIEVCLRKLEDSRRRRRRPG